MELTDVQILGLCIIVLTGLLGYHMYTTGKGHDDHDDRLADIEDWIAAKDGLGDEIPD